MIVPVLPHDDGILAQLPFVVFRPMRGVDKEPNAVAMPKAFLGIIWVFFLVRPRVMAKMIGTPAEGRILQCPSAGD